MDNVRAGGRPDVHWNGVAWRDAGGVFRPLCPNDATPLMFWPYDYAFSPAGRQGPKELDDGHYVSVNEQSFGAGSLYCPTHADEFFFPTGMTVAEASDTLRAILGRLQKEVE